jgi:hypothetical protein
MPVGVDVGERRQDRGAAEQATSGATTDAPDSLATPGPRKITLPVCIASSVGARDRRLLPN